MSFGATATLARPNHGSKAIVADPALSATSRHTARRPRRDGRCAGRSSRAPACRARVMRAPRRRAGDGARPRDRHRRHRLHGSALVEQFVRERQHVVVIDKMVNGKHADLAHLSAPDIRLVVADVRSRRPSPRSSPPPGRFPSRLPRGAPFAACSGRRSRRNAGGTLSLLEAALAAGVPRFVHVSSSEVYGPAQVPQMDEDHPTGRPPSMAPRSSAARPTPGRSMRPTAW